MLAQLSPSAPDHGIHFGLGQIGPKSLKLDGTCPKTEYTRNALEGLYILIQDQSEFHLTFVSIANQVGSDASGHFSTVYFMVYKPPGNKSSSKNFGEKGTKFWIDDLEIRRQQLWILVSTTLKFIALIEMRPAVGHPKKNLYPCILPNASPNYLSMPGGCEQRFRDHQPHWLNRARCPCPSRVHVAKKCPNSGATSLPYLNLKLYGTQGSSSKWRQLQGFSLWTEWGVNSKFARKCCC